MGDSIKLGIAVNGGQHPRLSRLKAFYLLLPIDDHGERRRLHPADGKHLSAPSIRSIFQRIESSSVHAKEPITDGT